MQCVSASARHFPRLAGVANKGVFGSGSSPGLQSITYGTQVCCEATVLEGTQEWSGRHWQGNPVRGGWGGLQPSKMLIERDVPGGVSPGCHPHI